MRVKIGKYRNGWIGPYQISGLLRLVGFSQDRCDAIVKRLSKTRLRQVCEWIDNHNPFNHRKMKIHIDYWDTWSMDDTLSQIIAPMLRQLRKDQHGAPFVEDVDVPEQLRAAISNVEEKNGDVDENHFARWKFVLDEMIWAFEQLEGDGNWDDQYHSGEVDMEWKEIKGEFSDDETSSKEPLYEMFHGPNDTHVFDKEGYEKHSVRMENGFRLFGKYYSSLWD